MDTTVTFLHKIKFITLLSLIFLFPFWFLPFTQDFVATNKLYLLSFGSLILLFISAVELLVTKKFVWQKKALDLPVITFIFTVLLSVIISSPNKVQALLNTNFGIVQIVSLGILYFYVSRLEDKFRSKILEFLIVSSSIISVITIVITVQPFRSLSLPSYLEFLKNPNFSPLGSSIDLLVFLGLFMLILTLRFVIVDETDTNKKLRISQILFFILNTTAFLMVLYTSVKSLMLTKQQTLILPPFDISWYSAVEILKTPITALFGTGVDNFASIFTRVKDVLYNQSSSWQINAFTISRSALLHIETETGVIGLFAFFLILITAFKGLFSLKKLHKGIQKLLLPKVLLFVSVVITLFLFPPSIAFFLLFFVALAIITAQSELFDQPQKQVFDVSELLPIYLGTSVILFIFIGISGFLLAKTYYAEYYFRQSLDGIVSNNIKTLYDNQRLAIITNPYIERYRTSFSQTNMLVANNIASKVQTPTEGATNQPPQLSEEDRQTISQAIQAAISEGKAAASLNPQKASNWENLAGIYRNIINVAQGADAWTVSAYQRSIILDPQNPMYRLNLGGVFYSLNNWDEATKLFEQSIGLKPDWANAHYNLAWSLFQKKDYVRAVSEMQNALTLLDAGTAKVDYDRAQKELEEFKKMVPNEESKVEASPPTDEIPQELVLPSPAPSISPKIELPKSSSPEAN